MGSLEEQKAILDEAESLIERRDYDGAMSKLLEVDHPDLQSRRDFLMEQAQRQGK
ncbi:hypothetical protein TVAG_084770 [Trichomonas vaginalis G3]|uniref:UVR domain-containing protein n=1 Tax=Trichomonas vaginalis (strain ATCC PRA-98 / G3) TaxID=412133 RepID=A2F3R8_TRIV3|nr:hypothetical protein TVAGG3_1040060 [Trichomonas vaginalis G3]EAY00440.1 hypothetical protein TVAG_084770 [Trichomonas vaginalis G3]KAI5493474.1 hypothetical protein TVAGG3_1040060 [Trichomonas vaginalis G3]|eukprot:XP_001313369.1 hypothetical protein [Trichomonas vaginalis G3]